MTEFKIRGPFEIKTIKKLGGRILQEDGFWEHDKKRSIYRDKTGVYVFAIRTSRSNRYIPYYIGKATKSFGQEVFQADKLVKYQKSFLQFVRRTAVVFLVVSPTKRGPVNARHIGQMERSFIRIGFLVNRNIQNKQGVKQPKWSIRGIIRSHAKKKSSSAKAFSEMFKLTTE